MTASDLPAVAAIAQETLFPGDMLPEMAAAFLGGDNGSVWLVATDDDTPLGFAFTEREALTQTAWNMRALATAPDAQRRGVARALIGATEDWVVRHGARVLVVDTSSGDDFAPARACYDTAGYVQSGEIPQFWSEDEAKVIFSKLLQG